MKRVKQEAPLKILESKGYCSPEMARLARKYGYPATLQGARQALIDQMQKDLVAMGEQPMTLQQQEELLGSA